MSFEKATKEFLIYVKNRHKKQGFYNICNDFKCRILPYFNSKDIHEISKNDLLIWQDTILQLNFSNSYNKKLYYVFNLFLDFCVNYYDLKKNLLRDVGSFPKKIEKKKSDFYTLKEFNQFINCVDNIIYKLYFTTLFYVGLRPSEAMALNFNDLQGNYLVINKSIQRKGKREIDTTKNQSSIRTIAINKKLKRDLLHLKKYYKSIYSNFADDYFIFGGSKPLAPTTIDRIKKIACKKANIRCITQHQFRHSHATFLINNNIPINEVSRRLGHSKISTTTDIYIHQDLSQEKRVTRTLNSHILFYSICNDLKTILKHFIMF